MLTTVRDPKPKSDSSRIKVEVTRFSECAVFYLGLLRSLQRPNHAMGELVVLNLCDADTAVVLA